MAALSRRAVAEHGKASGRAKKLSLFVKGERVTAMGISRIDPTKVREVFSSFDRFPGRLISLVGFDAAGKTTQIEELGKRFRETGKEVVETRQPTDWYRSNELVQSFQARGGSPQEARILSLMAAADRLLHVRNVIVPALERGATIICDRYVYATFAVFIHRGVEVEFLVEINKGIPEPEQAYLLDVPAEELLRRLSERDGSNLQFEEQSMDRIESIVRTYKEMGSLLKHIDGTMQVHEVTQAIWNDFHGGNGSGLVL